jgi:hypothetical protein
MSRQRAKTLVSGEHGASKGKARLNYSSDDHLAKKQNLRRGVIAPLDGCQTKLMRIYFS